MKNVTLKVDDGNCTMPYELLQRKGGDSIGRVEFLEWLEDIIDPHLEVKKATLLPIDDAIIGDLVEKGGQ